METAKKFFEIIKTLFVKLLEAIFGVLGNLLQFIGNALQNRKR